MMFNDQVQSGIPDTTPSQALAMIADFATSKEFNGLRPYQKLYIVRIEQMIRKDLNSPTEEIDGLSSISYYVPYGKYREFDLDKDVFPGIPINITPVYILETEQWTFVWAFDLKREYVYEWDKVSEVYNSVKWRDRK